jgi:hypothetical protein
MLVIGLPSLLTCITCDAGLSDDRENGRPANAVSCDQTPAGFAGSPAVRTRHDTTVEARPAHRGEPCLWRRGIPYAESEAGNAAASGASGLHAQMNRRRDAVAGRPSFQGRTRFFGAATIAFAGRQCSG